MHVDVVHVVPSLHVGGVNRSLLNHLAQLSRGPHRHGVCVVAARGALTSAVEDLGVPVVALGHRRPTDLPRTVARLRRHIRASGASVVHSHLFLARTVAGLACRAGGVPMVATIHSSTPRRSIDPASGPLRARALRVVQHAADVLLTDQLVAVSHGVRDAYLEDRPRMARRVVVVPNGIDVDAIAATPRRPAPEVRAELGVGEGTALLVNVGRLVEAKRQWDVPGIVAALRARDLDVVAAIAGEGASRGEVERAIADRSLGDRVLLLGRRDDVIDLLGAADVVLVTSATEGLSVALLEAVAVGRPVVTSDIPPNREVRSAPDAPGFAPVGDLQAFADAVVAVLEDPEAAATAAARERDQLRESHGVVATSRALDDLYERVRRR